MAIFDRVGDRSDFTHVSAPVPTNGRDEVLFKGAAFGLNHADLLLTQDQHHVQTGSAYPACEGASRFGIHLIDDSRDIAPAVGLSIRI
jgi:NADPH:quinone reductase-like Zn-dependent oxidoreductase